MEGCVRHHSSTLLKLLGSYEPLLATWLAGSHLHLPQALPDTGKSGIGGDIVEAAAAGNRKRPIVRLFAEQ